MANTINIPNKNNFLISVFFINKNKVSINIIKNKINNFYSKNLPNSDIFNDIVLPLQNISCNDKKE